MGDSLSTEDYEMRIAAFQACRFARDYYTGPALESGGTSIKGQGAAPFVRRMLGSIVKPGMKVLDYGAGKFARNADFLRENGIEVFAYDPYNGSGSEGWGLGEVAKTAPAGEKFDVGFTAYVLNVVPEKIENRIIKHVRALSGKSVHITRNLDIFEMVKKALASGNSTVTAFFLDQFAPGHPGAAEALTDGTLDDETIMDFCLFGVQTSRGFQRIPMLEDKGFSLAANTQGFKAYIG